MVVCIPVVKDQGLDSPVSSHFRSAPAFIIADTDSGALRVLQNETHRQTPRTCEPVSVLSGEHIDAFLVGGIGLQALSDIEASGAKAFAVNGGTAREALAAFMKGNLQRVRVPR